MTNNYDITVRFTRSKKDIEEALKEYGNMEELENALALYFRKELKKLYQEECGEFMVQSIIIDGKFYPIKKKY